MEKTTKAELLYEFIKKNSKRSSFKKNVFSWDDISVQKNLSEDFIRAFSDELNWEMLLENHKLSIEIIEEFRDRIEPYNHILIGTQELNEDFMRDFQDQNEWIHISKAQKLSEDFIREFKGKLEWNYLSQHQTLSEDFIREFQDKVNWDYIFSFQELSEEFIEEFENEIKWDKVRYSKIPENLIRKHQDKVRWDRFKWEDNIDLSNEFIEEFVDKLELNHMSSVMTMPEEFLIKHKDKLDFSHVYNVSVNRDRKWSGEMLKLFHQEGVFTKRYWY